LTALHKGDITRKIPFFFSLSSHCARTGMEQEGTINMQCRCDRNRVYGSNARELWM